MAARSDTRMRERACAFERPRARRVGVERAMWRRRGRGAGERRGGVAVSVVERLRRGSRRRRKRADAAIMDKASGKFKFTEKHRNLA
jgi:hypothetical protein